MLRRSRYPLILVVGLFSLAAGSEVRAQTVQWDTVSIPSFSPVTLVAGGVASALAEDGSQISVTGSGTFVVEKPTTVTGGGVWLTRDPVGSVTDFGTYQVTEVLTFSEAGGTVPPGSIDKIGTIANLRSGVAVLRITYSDGSKGVLVVNCHLPVGGPAPIPEGISATKDFVDYWFIVPPIAGVDGNRTLFHETAPSVTPTPPASPTGSGALQVACPPDQVVVAGGSNAFASVNPGMATANLAGATVVGVRSDGQALTNFYPVGVTTITWTASDSAGAHATCAQTITVQGSFVVPGSANPHVDGITPDRGPLQQRAIIHGTGFADAQGTSYVLVGGRQVPVLFWTAVAIGIVINPLAYNQAALALNAAYPVQVVIPASGKSSNTVSFFLTDAAPAD
jgi:hypothetical protein